MIRGSDFGLESRLGERHQLLVVRGGIFEALDLLPLSGAIADIARPAAGLTRSRMTQFGPIEIEKALNLDGTEGLRRVPLPP